MDRFAKSANLTEEQTKRMKELMNQQAETLRGIFATASVNSNLSTNLKDVVGKSLWIEQLKAIGITLVLAVVATVIIAFVLKAVLGLRPTIEAEQEGLDLSDHGEEGYIYEAKG